MHTDTLQRLFRHKAWENEGMLRSMQQLDSASPVAELATAILGHTYAVDQIFAANMLRKAHGYTSPNPSPALTLEELSEAIKASDQWYVDYVSRLEPEQLAERIDFTFTDGAPGRMSREEMLMHVITHGEQHRGQLGSLMELNSVSVPALGFTTYLHQAEASGRRREDVPGKPVVPRGLDAGASEGDLQGSREAAAGTLSRLNDLTERMRRAVGNDAGLGKTLKLDFKGEGFIFIDGGSVTQEDRPADLTLRIAMDDLQALAQGKLSPTAAMMTGRLRVSDMGVAAGLRDRLKALFSRMR